VTCALAWGCGRIGFTPTIDSPSPIAASFETESGAIVPAFQIVDDVTASGGQYLLDSNSAGTTGPGSDTLTFSLPQDASYYMWARTRSPDSGTDSFFVAFDGAAPAAFDTSECIHDQTWHWVTLRLFTANCPQIGPVVSVTLAAGAHTLVLSAREGGSMIDRIELSSDPSFVASD